MDTPPRAAGNGLAPLAARASDSGFPSGPFPLSGCFALNSQSSAFPSPPFPPLPPFQSGAGRIPDISGPARAPPPPSAWSCPLRRGVLSSVPGRPLLPKAGSAAPRSSSRGGGGGLAPLAGAGSHPKHRPGGGRPHRQRAKGRRPDRSTGSLLSPGLVPGASSPGPGPSEERGPRQGRGRDPAVSQQEGETAVVTKRSSFPGSAAPPAVVGPAQDAR